MHVSTIDRDQVLCTSVCPTYASHECQVFLGAGKAASVQFETGCSAVLSTCKGCIHKRPTWMSTSSDELPCIERDCNIRCWICDQALHDEEEECVQDSASNHQDVSVGGQQPRSGQKPFRMAPPQPAGVR